MTFRRPLVVINGVVQELPQAAFLPLTYVPEPLCLNTTEPPEQVFTTDGDIVMGLTLYSGPFNFQG